MDGNEKYETKKFNGYTFPEQVVLKKGPLVSASEIEKQKNERKAAAIQKIKELIEENKTKTQENKLNERFAKVLQDGEKFDLDIHGTVRDSLGETFDIGMREAAEGLEVGKLDKDGVGETFDIGMREAAEGLESVEVGKLDDDVNSPV